MNKESNFNMFISGVAPKLYPTETMYGLLWYGEGNSDAIDIPQLFPYNGDWGTVLSTKLLLQQNYPMPFKVDMVWLSIVEQRFYYIEKELPVKEMKIKWEQMDDILHEKLYSHIVIGMAPYGGVAVWFNGENKSILIKWFNAEEVNVDIKDFLPNRKDITLCDYCYLYINNDLSVKERLEKNGLPPRDLFDNYMKQFTFRYQVAFEKWNGEKWEKYNEDEASPEFDYIEEALFDGTHDKLHDGGLMKYHEAGKPKKLKVQFHVGGDTKDGKKRPVQEFSAYFWFEDERIRDVFDKFYGAHPDTKADFIIKIDAEKNKYQVAMYRYGLKEPVVLADDVYQLIIFRNKFECYRSENYDQPRGAWIW